MIIQGMCVSFKKEILEAVHDFTSDTFKLALYVDSADVTPITTTAYTTSGEASGLNYTAGGVTLTATGPTTSGLYAICDFADVVFSNVTLSARGGLIYNSSKANRAVAIVDFGLTKTTQASNLTITFPAADTDNAIVRIA